MKLITFLLEEVDMHELKCFKYFYSKYCYITKEIFKFIGHIHKQEGEINYP